MSVRGRGARRRPLRWLILAVSVLGLLAALLWYVLSPELTAPSREPPSGPPARGHQLPGQGYLMMQTDPPGATIIVDEHPTGRMTPDFVVIDAGRDHDVRVELEGYETVRLVLSLSDGERREVELSLIPVD